MENHILLDINSIKLIHKSDKDGGINLLKSLSNYYTNNSLKYENKELDSFLLDELEYDRNGMRWLSLGLLVEVQAYGLGNDIYIRLLHNNLEYDKEQYRTILESLLDLRFSNNEYIYIEYFDYLLVEKKYISLLNLLIKYYFINEEKSCEYLGRQVFDRIGYNEMYSLLTNRIAYILAYFDKFKSIKLIPKYIFELSRFNIAVSRMFSEIISNNLNSPNIEFTLSKNSIEFLHSTLNFD